MLTLLVAVIACALVFDYTNGFHDTANAIATNVATGVLPIRTAVLVAGFFNFVGAILMGTGVAGTIADLVQPGVATLPLLLATLIGAMAWNLITWWWGIPSSSSHALIGALAGASVAKAGVDAFHWEQLWNSVLKPLVVSPLTGFVIALGLMVALIWILRRLRPRTVQVVSRRIQLITSSTLAFSHGSNDAQKSMGVILLALIAYLSTGAELPHWMLPHKHVRMVAGVEKVGYEVPYWVMASCATAMGLGTFAGGKRIIKTMGSKISRISNLQGLAAETAGTITILTATHYKLPISTTHCINAAIMGVGASRRVSAVRWIVAWKILVAWIVTLPLSAAVAWSVMMLLRAFGWT